MGEAGSRDRELVERMLSGREEAFTEFFAGHFPRLFRFALARLGHDADSAEEVVQSTLCRAIDRLATYRGEAALFTWLCTLCRHEIAEWYRKRNRALPAEGVEDWPEIREALESLSSEPDRGPDGELRRKELARLVQVVLDSLPHPYGDALEWKYLEETSVREIATRLGLTPKAAESMLTRARQAFREGFALLAGEGRRTEPLEG